MRPGQAAVPNSAALYLRLSGSSGKSKTGLLTQEQDLRAMAADLAVRVAAVHCDDGMSGAAVSRSGLAAWLDDAREGRADHLLAWSVDRVSRLGPGGLLPIFDLVDGMEGVKPIRFLAFADGVDSQEFDWEVRATKAALEARREREVIQRRLVRYREANREAGRVVGGRRPWAFDIAELPGGGFSLVPIDEHASAIRWALEHLRGGGSMADIAREWTKLGLQPKGHNRRATSGAWHLSPLRRILSNPNLYGATLHRGQLVTDADGSLRCNTSQAILTRDEWNEMQALLEARRGPRRASPSGRELSLLASLVHCSSCSRPMYAFTSRPVPSYVCGGGPSCASPAGISIACLDNFVMKLVVDHAAHRVVPVHTNARIPRDHVREGLVSDLARLDEALPFATDVDEALEIVDQRRELRKLIRRHDNRVRCDAAEATRSWTVAEALTQANSTSDRRAVMESIIERIDVLPGKRGGSPVFDPRRAQVRMREV